MLHNPYPLAEQENRNYETTGLDDLNLSPDPVLFTAQTRTLKGERFSFKGRRYLLPIYRDKSQRLKIVKGRQTEMSEFIVNWFMYNLIQNPYTIGLYMSDRSSHTSLFSNLRVKEWTLRSSPILQRFAPLDKHAATHLELINGSHLYFFSAWSQFEEARSVPADFAAVDERQAVDGKAIDVLIETMAHSKHNKLIEVGTGADEGSDWELSYVESDMKEWDPASQSWIVTQKDPEIAKISSGYHIPQTIVPWITAAQLEEKEKKGGRYYVTEVLGWFYHGVAKPITTKMVRGLFDYNRPLIRGSAVDHSLGPVFCGFDWGGGEKAFTVPWVEQHNLQTGQKILLWTEKIDNPDLDWQAKHAENIIRAYRPTFTVVDGGGGLHQTQHLERVFGAAMTKCYYVRSPAASNPKQFMFRVEAMPISVNRRDNSVQVNRTWLIDRRISQIKQRLPHPTDPAGMPYQVIPAEDEEAVEFILDHFTAIESKLVKASAGDYTIYDHAEDDPDDALHASGYAELASLLYGFRPRAKIGTGTLGGKGRQ